MDDFGNQYLAPIAAAPAEGLREAVKAYVAWQYRMPGQQRFTLTDLRAALARRESGSEK